MTSLKLAAAAFALTLLASVPAAADAVLQLPRRHGMLQVNTQKCLDAHAPTMQQDGGRVQIWRCNGAQQQQWTAFANGSLRNAGGLCLDVHAPDQALTARVQVWQCNGSPQQRFTTAPSSTSITPDTSVRPPAIR